MFYGKLASAVASTAVRLGNGVKGPTFESWWWHYQWYGPSDHNQYILHEKHFNILRELFTEFRSKRINVMSSANKLNFISFLLILIPLFKNIDSILLYIVFIYLMKLFQSLHVQVF